MSDRYKFVTYVGDQEGNALSSASYSVYKAGTSTAVTVYTAEVGGTSSSSTPQGYSDSNGKVEFWVSEGDYAHNQKFKIVISHADLNSDINLDNEDIFPSAVPIPDDNDLIKNSSDNTKLVKISAASITTGNSRTLTMADVDVDLGNFSPVQDGFAAAMVGFIRRPVFTWTDSDTITIGPGCYYHNGTSVQMLSWTSDLTLDFSGLSVSTWYYVYLDDSAIVTADTYVISASELTYSSTAPTWSDSKWGWYNGSDLCIFAVKTDSSGNLIDFSHDGGRYVAMNNNEIRSQSTIPDSWETVTCSYMPGFSTLAYLTLAPNGTGSHNSSIYFRVDSNDNNHAIARIEQSDTDSRTTFMFHTTSSQTLQFKQNNSNANSAAISQEGWFLPRGM